MFSLVLAHEGLVAVFSVACWKWLKQHLRALRQSFTFSDEEKSDAAYHWATAATKLPPFPIVSAFAAPLCEWLPNRRRGKINKETNKQGAVGKAHKISIVAPALFLPYLLSRECKGSMV